MLHVYILLFVRLYLDTDMINRFQSYGKTVRFILTVHRLNGITEKQERGHMILIFIDIFAMIFFYIRCFEAHIYSFLF
jgi:hypothetical protein